MTVQELTRLLQQKAGYQTLDVSTEGGQVRLLGRVPPNAADQWILVVHRLLVESESADWKVDVSRKYFLRGPSKKMVYSWRLVFNSASPTEAMISNVMRAVQNAPRPQKTEISEFPLAGASRAVSNGGRGASTINGDGGLPSIIRSKLGR
jgi:hypothetical protein